MPVQRPGDATYGQVGNGGRQVAVAAHDGGNLRVWRQGAIACGQGRAAAHGHFDRLVVHHHQVVGVFGQHSAAGTVHLEVDAREQAPVKAGLGDQASVGAAADIFLVRVTADHHLHRRVQSVGNVHNVAFKAGTAFV